MRIDRLKLLAYLCAIFNPIPLGLISGAILYSDPKYRKSGRNVFAISMILIIVIIVLLAYLGIKSQ